MKLKLCLLKERIIFQVTQEPNNVGYSNNTTGESLGLATRLENGETFSIDPPTGVKVAVRASTYDTVATWSMEVTGSGFIYK